MENYQLLICCVVSLLTLRKDISQFILVSYCLYYLVSDYFLKYDFLFYHQHFLILLDLGVLVVCAKLLILRIDYNIKDNTQTSLDINLLLSVGLTITSVTYINCLILNGVLDIEVVNLKVYLYLLSNWHYEFLTLLLININFQETINIRNKTFKSLLSGAGLTTIIYLSVINYIL